MLKIITFFCVAITFVIAQDAEVNEACGSQTININYYYSKDINPVAGPSIQPPNDILQGRPGKVERGHQGEAGVSDNSVVDLLRSELANLTTKIVQIKEENNEMAEELQRQLNESRRDVARLTARLSKVEDENNENTVELQRQLNESRRDVARLTTQLTEVEDENTENTEEIRRQLNNITYATANLTSGCNGSVRLSGTYFIIVDQHLCKIRCEVESDGRNWLVFQRRIDGSVDFYRNWYEYKRGFGDSEGNYWLGLDLIHSITSSGSYQLRVDLEDWENNTAYALYSSFSVGNQSSNYRLSVYGYDGTAGDSLNRNNNQQFSTFDRNSNANGGHCAASYHGAWWYSNGCGYSNLNGKIQRGLTGGRANVWYYWGNKWSSLKRSVMKISLN